VQAVKKPGQEVLGVLLIGVFEARLKLSDYGLDVRNAL
jgi:hypothetical protein